MEWYHWVVIISVFIIAYGVQKKSRVFARKDPTTNPPTSRKINKNNR
jgi:hypothetical protein